MRPGFSFTVPKRKLAAPKFQITRALFNSPRDASVIMENCITKWNSPEHNAYLRRWAMDGTQQRAQGWGEPEARSLISIGPHLQRMPLYAVMAEASALIQAGAESLKPQPILKSDLPSPEGIVLFQYPLTAIDIHLREYKIIAAMWIQSIDGENNHTVSILQFTDWHDLENVWRYKNLTHHMPTLSLLHVQTASYDLLYAPPAEDDHGEYVPVEARQSAMHHMAFMQAFWAFVQQKVVVAEDHVHAREVRKRLAKDSYRLGNLKMVHLRSIARGSVTPSDSPHHVDWKKRWVVRGHWRQQWYKSLQNHRQIWVWPYVKGPENMPLYERKTVYTVAR